MIVLGTLISLVASSPSPSLNSVSSAAEQKKLLGLIRAFPSTILTNTPVPVKVIAEVLSADVIPESVVLRRDGEIIGVLHDDGAKGDSVAGDGFYTIVITLNEPRVTSIALRVSARFRGVATEVFSEPFSIEVSAADVLCPRPATVTVGPNGTFKLPDLTGRDPDVPPAILVNAGTFASGATIKQNPEPGTTFTAPATVTVTFTVSDSTGKTAGCSFTISVVDSLPPEISVTGVRQGDAFTTKECAKPVITVRDNRDRLEDIKVQATLNGKPYTGSPVCEAGRYSLRVSAKDTFGNTSEFPEIVFAVVDTAKTRGAAIKVREMSCTQGPKGATMTAKVLLSSDQFDVFEIDGYSVILHAFGPDPDREVLDRKNIHIAEGSFKQGVWELTFRTQEGDGVLVACPAQLLMTGTAFLGELDWVAGRPPAPLVVSLAPLNVPLAPATPSSSAEAAILSKPGDSRQRELTREALAASPFCPNCKWKSIEDFAVDRADESRFARCISVFREEQFVILHLWAGLGRIAGNAEAKDQCTGAADAAGAAIGRLTIKVFLEGGEQAEKCCGCEIDLEAHPSFKATSNLDPPGLAKAGGRIQVKGDLEAKAEGAAVSGSGTESISFEIPRVGGEVTLPAISRGDGKVEEIYSDSDIKTLQKCQVKLTVTGTGHLKVLADAVIYNPYAKAEAKLSESKRGIKIHPKCKGEKVCKGSCEEMKWD